VVSRLELEGTSTTPAPAPEKKIMLVELKWITKGRNGMGLVVGSRENNVPQ
jgi:hypothetical protein